MERRGKIVRSLMIAFTEGVIWTILWRGTYFLLYEVFHFSQTLNLLVSTGLGLGYLLGAKCSHFFTQRLGERRTLWILSLLQIGSLAIMLLLPEIHLLIGGLIFNMLLLGMLWPINASYVGAGRTVRGTAAAVSWFNISWALPIALCMPVVSPVLSWWPPGLFGLAVVMALIKLSLVWKADPSPLRFADEPHDSPAVQLQRYRPLLLSARMVQLTAMGLFFLLAPLMPQIMNTANVSIEGRSAAAGLLDFLRVAVFLILGATHWWHGRGSVLLFCVLTLPIGFVMILHGEDLGTIMIGQIIFGISTALAYHLSLYYAIALHNASIRSVGITESMTGLAMLLGPLAGLVGVMLGLPSMGGWLLGSLLLILGISALWPLLVAPTRKQALSPDPSVQPITVEIDQDVLAQFQYQRSKSAEAKGLEL